MRRKFRTRVKGRSPRQCERRTLEFALLCERVLQASASLEIAAVSALELVIADTLLNILTESACAPVLCRTPERWYRYND